MDSDSDISYTPPELLEAANEASLKLLPAKSKKLYDKAYSKFMEWQANKKSSSFSETVLLAYFLEMSKQMMPSTVWAQYSMLRCTLNAKNNIDISKYMKLISFLKQNSKGYRPKRSNIFTRKQINKFLKDAPDDSYLLTKVILIFGIAGACRSHELSQMTLDDVEDSEMSLMVKITETKNNVQRRFVVSGEYLTFYRKYMALRPSVTKDRRLFYGYRNKKCFNQVVGRNQFYKIPEIVATYLKLENPKLYTGHAFRRSSATILVESGGDLLTLKKHGGWKSSTVAEGYIDESAAQRKEIAHKVLGSCNSSITALPTVSPNLERSEKITSFKQHESPEIFIDKAGTSKQPQEMHFVQSTFNNCTFNIINNCKN